MAPLEISGVGDGNSTRDLLITKGIARVGACPILWQFCDISVDGKHERQ